MRVLIACEESQTMCKAFRERGHEAFSCDLVDCSGGHPEWHIKDDDGLEELLSSEYFTRKLVTSYGETTAAQIIMSQLDNFTTNPSN